MKKPAMITKIIKKVQHELINYNSEQRALFSIATFLSVGLLLSIAFLLTQLWSYAAFLKEQCIE